MDDLSNRRRKERRLWLVGTILMTVAPARFAAAALMAPPPAPMHGALLTPPLWLAQLLTPIDQSLRSSGATVLPAMVVLFLLLRLWINYGRRLLKPLPISATAGD